MKEKLGSGSILPMKFGIFSFISSSSVPETSIPNSIADYYSVEFLNPSCHRLAPSFEKKLARLLSLSLREL